MECALCAATLPRDIGNWVLDDQVVCHECAHRCAERARYKPNDSPAPPTVAAAAAVNTCDDCAAPDTLEELAIVAADFGEGAFLAILCATCLHRREYRGHLRRKKALRRWLAVRSDAGQARPTVEWQARVPAAQTRHLG